MAESTTTDTPSARTPRTNEDVLREACRRYEVGFKADEENFNAGGDDLCFLAGEQWPDQIRLDREDEGRPMLTINQLPQFVAQVTGDMRQARPSVKISAADDKTDRETADIFEGLVRHIENISDGTAIYQAGAFYQVAAGMGAFRVDTQYLGDDVFDQEILLRPIANPFGVVWDPDSIMPTREDAQWCFVVDAMSPDAFKEKYPDADTASFDGGLEPWMTGWITRETIRVAEYWVKRPKWKEIAELRDGKIVDVTKLSAAQRKFLPIKRTRKAKLPCVYQYVLNGNEVLSGPNEWPGQFIPIVPIIGQEIRIGARCVRHGIVRFAKDSQRLYNYWRTAQTEGIALQPKAPFVVTTSQMEGVEDIWRSANTKNLPYLPYKFAAGHPVPQRSQPAVASSGMAEELRVARDDMQATVGIYNAALGKAGPENSGKAIRARQQESDTATFSYPANLALAIRHCGQILVDLIPKIYDTERVIRILGEDGTANFVPINVVMQGVDGPVTVNDLSAGRYSVTVSTGPAYATKRAEATEGMIALIQAVPSAGAAIMDLVAQNQDWPGAEMIAERLKKLLPPGLADSTSGQPGQPQPGQPPGAVPQGAPPQAPPTGAPMPANDPSKQAAAVLSMAKAEREHIGAQMDQIELDRMKTGGAGPSGPGVTQPSPPANSLTGPAKEAAVVAGIQGKNVAQQLANEQAIHNLAHARATALTQTNTLAPQPGGP